LINQNNFSNKIINRKSLKMNTLDKDMMDKFDQNNFLNYEEYIKVMSDNEKKKLV
jgi:hypothetical protein